MHKVRMIMKKRTGLFQTIEGSIEIVADSVDEILEIKNKIGDLKVS